MHEHQRILCENGFLVMQCRCKGSKIDKIVACSVECKQHNHDNRRGRKKK